MNGDFSRLTFGPERRYSSVRLQQGRVFVDADWNEEHDILAHRIETETIDVVGRCGAPLHAAGFHVVASAAELTPDEAVLPGNANPPAGALLVSAGRYYAGGVMVENHRIVAITEQPDLLPGGGTAPLVLTAAGATLPFPPPPGSYLVFLDVWQRHVSALQDDSLREKALGGPDTATRTRSSWQVRLLEVPAGTSCSAEPPAWLALLAPPSGRMTARTVEPTVADNPCDISTGGGYRRLENQLYRVEIQDSGDLGAATFKWSRDNASVITGWLGNGATADQLAVATIGPDDVLRFAPQQWVELIDDEREMAGVPGTMVQLGNAENGVLTILPATAAGPTAYSAFKTHPRVRRWEADAGGVALRKVETPAANGGFLALEDGVEIRFSAGSYRSGDYWLIPARTATASIEWPAGEALPPRGISHNRCRLGIAEIAASGIKVTDCRPIFPPLTAIETGADLKHHNRHLHGWGVVCGLQVHCAGGQRQQVLVEPGYAIACDGSDIKVGDRQTLDLVEAAKKAGLLDAGGSGKACISLVPAAGGTFALAVGADPDAKTSFLERVLDGTLLKDVIDDCVVPLIDKLGNQLRHDAPEAVLPLSEQHRNTTAALNLLIQLVNKSRGPRIHVSADEHERFIKLHDRLVKLLFSPTFCGIADGRGSFPAYPFGDSGVGTVYGKAAHRMLRFDALRDRILSFGGASAALHGYGRSSGELETQLTLPGENLTLRDVLPLADRLLVVATDASNSVFFTLDADGLKLTAAPVVVSQTQVMRLLGWTPDPAADVYALVQGVGLVTFKPTAPQSLDARRPALEFKATGHLSSVVFSQRGLIELLAGVATADARFVRYDAVVRILFRQGMLTDAGTTLLRTPQGQPASGQDAIELVHSELGYAVVDDGAGKSLLQLTGGDIARRSIALGQPGAVALTAFPGAGVTLMTLENEYILTWIGADAERLEDADRLPLQMGPSAVAIVGEATLGTAQIVALNSASATLTVAPLDYALNKRSFDMPALAAYRGAMLQVCAELLLRLLQQVKDCICDHLLVQCPSCDENDVVVLACVDVRDSEVHAICPFHRREVITFPKLSYWLSAVPLLPLLHEAIRVACCAVLPDLVKDGPKSSGDLVSSQQAGRATVAIRSLDLAAMKKAAGSYFGSVGNLSLQRLSKAVIDIEPRLARSATGSVLERSASGASQSLASRGVEVASVQPASEAMLRADAPKLTAVPMMLAPGDRVHLYTQNGKVVFYTRAEPASAPHATSAIAAADAAVPAASPATPPSEPEAPDAAMRIAIDAHAREIGALKAELEQLRTAVAAAGAPAKKRAARGRT